VKKRNEVPEPDKKCMKIISSCDGKIKYRILISRVKDDARFYRFLCEHCCRVIGMAPRVAEVMVARTVEITKI
jgi:hypothetical protein